MFTLEPLTNFLPPRLDSRALRDSLTPLLPLDKRARYETTGNVEPDPSPVQTSPTCLNLGEGTGDCGDLEKKIMQFLSAKGVGSQDAILSQPPINIWIQQYTCA